MPTQTTVTIRYFAAARAAAGTDEEKLTVAAGVTVEDVLDAVRDRHGAALARVLQRCGYLLDEVAVRDRTAPLAHGAMLDVLPPFAGG